MAFIPIAASAQPIRMWHIERFDSRNFNTTQMEGGGPADVPATSDRPRCGSRNVKNATTETTSPGIPMATKAARQLTASAIQPPRLEPTTTPNGAPSQIMDIAEARFSIG